MSARPPATRDVLELPGGLFRLRQIAPPFEGSATKANPAKAGDAKPRGYRTPFACHASRAAAVLEEDLCFLERYGDGPWRLPLSRSPRAIYKADSLCPATKR